MSNYELIKFKRLSRTNQLGCVISYFFQLHLMLYACVRIFDVTSTVEIFFGTKQSYTRKEWQAGPAPAHDDGRWTRRQNTILSRVDYQ